MFETFTHTWLGYFCLGVFLLGYYYIIRENKYGLNKTVPALFSGTLMFLIIGGYFVLEGFDITLLNMHLKDLVFEIAEIYFFLFVAMTYIEVLIERNIFTVLKHKLIIQGFSFKKIYWIIGFLAFSLSPIVDNLTTALVLSTVVLTLTKDKQFLLISALNIIVAANAGGGFSPFGDITTLMAWTSGKGEFFDFFLLFPSAFIGWLFVSFALSYYLPDIEISQAKLLKHRMKSVYCKPGALTVSMLGIFTILISVFSHHFFHIPAMWGMMFGLALLELFTYRLDRKGTIEHYYIYKKMRKVQMDTLLFFFGILSMISALSFLGYLAYIYLFYNTVGITGGNIFVGFASAIFGNVGIMSAVLNSGMQMSGEAWLFLTLTVGIGGSLISFGSAAGIGVMGKMPGIYTFSNHLKYFPVLLAGYFLSIGIYYFQFYIS